MADKSTSTDSCSGSSSCTLVNSTTSSYSGERLVSGTIGLISGCGITYTAWDSKDRATSGTWSSGCGSPLANTTATTTYDDTARSSTTIASGVTITSTSDINGNPISSVTSSSGFTSTSNYTTTATTEVCK